MPCITAGALTLVGCGASSETFVLTQGDGDSVVLTELELNPTDTAGDTTVFEGPLQKEGEPCGSIMGSMTKVGAIGAGWREDREERMLTSVFDLPIGQISAQRRRHLHPHTEPDSLTLLSSAAQVVAPTMGRTTEK